MPTNWIALSAGDLIKVIHTQYRTKSDENIGEDVQPDQAFDPDQPSRADEIVKLVIAQFRGAIQVAGKYPLSVTPNTVPPEVVKHVLNMAAFELVNSSPTLQMAVITEKGAYSPFQSFYKTAQEYLDALTKGRNIVFPTDPTGEDYINPINVIWCGGDGDADADDVNPYPDYDSTKPINKPISSIRFGASSPSTDMNTYQGIFGKRNAKFPSDEIGQP